MKLLISLLALFISLPFSSLSQVSLDSLQRFHQDNIESLVLLKNDNRILPFKDLSDKHLAHLSIGDEIRTKEFNAILQKYTEIKSFNLPLDANGNQAGAIFKYLINYSDVAIISVSDSFSVDYSPIIEDFLRDLSKRIDIVYTFFGKSDLVKNFPHVNRAKAILYSPKTMDYTQSLAAQIHFGAIGAIGKLTEEIGPKYKVNDGIVTKGGIRLSYGFPELVGVNSTYLEHHLKLIIQEGITAQAFPGAQVLIAKDGQVIYQNNFGFHTYNKQQTVRSTDIYDLASLTKVTTATPALMRLQDEGLFDVDAKLVKYFPNFKGSDKADLYFRSILAHNAQLKPYIVYWRKAQKKNGKYRWRTFKNKPRKNYPIKVADYLYLHKKYKGKIMDYIKKSPLNKDTGYVYSGLTFLMYPDLVKAQTGQQFDRYLYDTFYRKIGANRLVFNPLQKFSSTEIIPTEEDALFRKKLVHGTVHDEAAAMLGGISANAGLFGNANDLAKLLQLYLNRGSYGGAQFIKKSTFQEFTQCQFCEEGNRRGLGFDKPLIEYDESKSYIAKSASKYSFGHSGFTGTFFWLDPAENLMVIFLSNRVFPTRENRKLYSMNIRQRIHQAAYDAIYDFDKLKQKETNHKSKTKHYEERK